MKKNTTSLIFGISIGIIIGIILGYLIFGLGDKQQDFKNNFGGDNFNLDELEISNVQNFFESSPTDSEIEIYCSENIDSCMYYCMKNSESNYCDNLMPENIENRTPPSGMGFER